MIVYVTADEVTWLALSGRFHFDRPSARTSLTPGYGVSLDIHEGRLAIQHDEGATEVLLDLGHHAEGGLSAARWSAAFRS